MENTIIQLLTTRGYKDITKEQDITVNKEQLSIVTARYINIRNKQQEEVCCVYHKNQNKCITKTIIKCLTGKLKAYTHFILVSYSVSCHILRHFRQLQCYFEHLTYSDITNTIFNHIYVPVYRLLSQQEVKEVENTYGKKEMYPKMIARLDAIGKYMDFRQGDVLEIKKRYQPNFIMYRLVVPLLSIS
jgi:DNA-directed RNA polymerase subunit H (RpoH/RPB5)